MAIILPSSVLEFKDAANIHTQPIMWHINKNTKQINKSLFVFSEKIKNSNYF
jgi:hypothetical protein